MMSRDIPNQAEPQRRASDDAPAVLDFSTTVRGERGDEMAHPAEQAARPEPHPGRDDEPEEASQKVAVVDLSHAWNEQAEDRGQPGFFTSDHLEQVRSPAFSGCRAGQQGAAWNVVT